MSRGGIEVAKLWQHNGYEIDEGFKPRDGNFKPDYYQYFFLIKKKGVRVMKFCVWGAKEFVDGVPEAADDPVGYLRSRAIETIKSRIDDGSFEDTLLELSALGERLIPLEQVDKKLE